MSIEFVNKASADFLYENKRKLPKGLYVDREYNAEVEKECRILKPILRKAKQLDDYHSKSRLDGNQLIIKGRSYTTHDLNQLPESLSGFASTTETDTSSIGFFGELNIFSNFNPAIFTPHDITFHSSEQYIQYQKSKLFRDTKTCQHILESEDTLEAKKIARDINGFDFREWKDKARELCEPGILAKFLQNPF